MKFKMSFWQIVLMSIVAAMFVCVSACNSDDPTPDPDPTPTPNTNPKDNGEVSFTIELPQGGGNGSSSSPATVEKGDTLNMAISQKSSYTDPDGTVFTCEPKATIELFAKLDTVYAKDIENLTKVKEGSDIKTNKTGTDPVCNQTVQTFDIGGQNIVFDLSHEIYTYVNSTKEKIEMPYIKLNQAKLGGNSTAETRSVAVMTGVSVRPLAETRGRVIRDSTMYEVNARFSVDIESVNTKDEATQTLEFSINYIGVVETVTELADPVSELSYVWEAKSGTNSQTSPFVKTNGDIMEIWMTQTSSYTDEYGNKASGEPKAKIKLSVAQDSIWAKSIEDLKAFAEKTEEKPSGQFATQKFGSALQSVDIEWSYENGEAVLAGQPIAMPFYSLTPVELKDVSLKDVSDDKATKAQASVYEVTVTFGQKAVAQNVVTEASEIEVEYVISYIGTILKDPISDLSFAWEVKSGTKSKTSPFVKAKGDIMEIWMAQASSYVDEYGNRATCEPKAKIKLSAAQDTVWAKTVDELKAFAEMTEGKPSGNSATQKFGSALQNVNIEWSYENGEADLAGKTIPMPFYTLSPVTLKDVSVKEASEAIIDGKMADIYNITATFSQKAIAKNVTTDTSEIEIEYVVSYTGAIEVTLVKVEYYPSGQWIDPHDNMPLLYYAKVERYRTYSNGKRVGPDEFYDYGHPSYLSTGESSPGVYQYGDETMTVYAPSDVCVGDSIRTYKETIQFSSAKGDFSTQLSRDDTSDLDFLKYNWSIYELDRLLGEDLNPCTNSPCSQFNNHDTRPAGWYFYPFLCKKEYDIYWAISDTESIPVGGISGIFEFYDQFLIIDERRIDFKSLHNLKINYALSEEKLSTADKDGKIIKLEMHASYLGKKFVLTRTCTVYVAK